MKVCFLVKSINGFGGQQRVIINVANQLSTYENLEIFILVRTKNHTKIEYPLNEAVKLIYDSSLERPMYKYLFSKLFVYMYKKFRLDSNDIVLKKLLFPKREIEAFENFLGKYNFDVIIANAPYLSILLTQLRINVKKVGWLHSTYERYFEIKKSFGYNQGRMYSVFLKNLDEIVVLTEQAKKIYFEKIGKEPISISNPLSFTMDDKSRLDNNNILFVGRLDPETKGLEYLIEIASTLRLKNVDFKLFVVGDGSQDTVTKLKKQIVELDLSNFVFLKGPSDNVEKYYQNSSICIVPSTVEGFGLVVLEAFEAGVPVVSFATEGPSEIIEDGISGFVIPKFDVELFCSKISYLLNNQEKKELMGHMASVRAKEYNIKSIGEEWYNLLTKRL